MQYYILIILIFINCAMYSVSVTLPSLQLVSVLFRHGDRNTNDDTNGDLTLAGRRRAYQLGIELRKMYANFLDDVYEPAAVSSRSSGYIRTKMSLQLLLASLYVPQKYQRWHESLAWQPIPFSYRPDNDDILLFPRDCPRFTREIEKSEVTPEFQKLLDPYRDMMRNVSISSGTEIKDSLDMFLLYHTLAAMKSMNETLPEWANGIFPDGALLSGTFLYYDLLKYTDWMRRINGGTVVRKIVDDMLDKTKEKRENKIKIFLYSAHELNIVAVLQTLKVWEPHIPEYSSAVIIELREDSKNYYVKILYTKGIPEAFKEMQIPGCLTLCPLDRFIEILSDNLPTYDEIICDYKPVALN